jgi:hypothetical protein
MTKFVSPDIFMAPWHIFVDCVKPTCCSFVANDGSRVNHESLKDQDRTPRANANGWKPSTAMIGDVGNFHISTGYTPMLDIPSNPGDSMYLPASMDMNMDDFSHSISMPDADGIVHSATDSMDMSFNGFDSIHYQHFNNHFMHDPGPPHHQQYVPGTFYHDGGKDSVEHHSAMNSNHLMSVDGHHGPSDVMSAHRSSSRFESTQQLPPSAESFRYRATLIAPTAMIRSADEIPITYLNKGQIYNITISDTQFPSQPSGTRYRTFIRVSFDEEQQRQKPAEYWSLWKEGRGTNEAQQRGGGRVQPIAVEHVDLGSPQVAENISKPSVELENQYFDGFSVIWTPAPGGPAECVISMRCNFLSTDYTYSKGVKGIALRLCAKTQQLASNSSPEPPTPEQHNLYTPELVYCKIKLFRDHGSERKQSVRVPVSADNGFVLTVSQNDLEHVNKSIDKVKQQIAQLESGVSTKKKRPSAASLQLQGGPGKAPKHKRTWSMSSASSAGGTDPVAEDLYQRLKTLEDMKTSQRPVSALFLRGSELDDPDLHPVILPGTTNGGDQGHHNPWASERGSATNSAFLSPSPSSMSLYSQVSNSVNGDARASRTDLTNPNLHRPAKVPEIDASGHFTGRWIEAVGIDSTYHPPPDTRPKPVACFYVRRVPGGLGEASSAATSPSEVSSSSSSSSSASSPDQQGQQGQQQQQKKYNDRTLYRAVYLTQRTARELVGRLAGKWSDLDINRVARVVRVVDNQSPSGNGGGSRLEVEVDDDVVAEIPEGVSMTLEVVPAGRSGNNNTTGQLNGESKKGEEEKVKHEWDMLVDVVPEQHGGTNGVGSGPVEFWLRY